jgi:hypothetical protein
MPLTDGCTFTIPGGWSITAEFYPSLAMNYDNTNISLWQAVTPTTLVWPLNYDPEASHSQGFDVHMVNSTFDGITNPLLTLGYLSLNISSLHISSVPTLSTALIKEAYTCSLTPCVNTYGLSVSNGVPTLEVLDTDFGNLVFISGDTNDSSRLPFHPAGLLDHWYSPVLDDGRKANSTWSSLLDQPWLLTYGGTVPNASEPANREVRFSTHWVNPIVFDGTFEGNDDTILMSVGAVSTIASVLSGNASEFKWYGNSTGNPNIFNEDKAPGLAEESAYYSSEAMVAISNASSFPDLMSNVAASLTLAFIDSSNLTVAGSEGHIEQFVQVGWIWLTLPMAIVVLGNAFLALVIIETKKIKARIWKNSTLAVIYHGYHGDAQELAHMEQISAMKKHAKGFKVRLKRHEKTALLGLSRE